MEPDLLQIDTPSGHKIFIKKKLNHKGYMEVRKVVSKHVLIDPVTQKADKVSGDSMIEAIEKVIAFVLVRVTTPDGRIIEQNVDEVVNNMDSEDTQKLIEEATRIYQESFPSKKNTNQ